MKRKSKKEMVLDIYDDEAMGEVTAREIAVINRRLVEEFGEGGAMSPAEIARVLVEEDLPVRFDQVLVMRSPNERYHRRFVDVMRSDSLEKAETALRSLDELSRQFMTRGDRAGLRAAREAVLTAKRRAQESAEQSATTTEQRQIWLEMAQWFTVWLQTPDLFETWLELRKASAEFKQHFGKIQQP